MSINPIQSYDFNNLQNSIEAHRIQAEKCESFFQLCAKSEYKTISGSIQFQYKSVFGSLFTHIRDGDLEKWEGTYHQISISENGEATQELNEVKDKLLLCKKINTLFCKKIIEILQKNAALILREDSVFFLPELGLSQGGLGECHCSQAMERGARHRFSNELCDEISSRFNKKTPLSIASIGAGSCFHELEIHFLLSNCGYEMSHWVLVDPLLNAQTVVNFETLLKWGTPNTTVISVNKTASEYFANLKNSAKAQPNVFLFIDVDFHVRLDDCKQATSQSQRPYCLAEYRKCDEVWKGINIQIIESE